MRAKKLLATAVAAATLGVGGLTVAAVNPLSSAAAQDEGASQVDPGTTDAPEGSRRGRVLDAALDDLVAEEAITQAQADAVKASVREKLEDGGEGRRGHRRGLARHVVTTAAEAIGIAPGELVAELKRGRSIAEVAEANEVEGQAVVDALVAASTTRIDQAVADEKLDAERAAKLKDSLPEAMARLVERTRTPR